MNGQEPTRKTGLWWRLPAAFLLLVPAYLLFALSSALAGTGKGLRKVAEWLTDAAFDLTSD